MVDLLLLNVNKEEDLTHDSRTPYQSRVVFVVVVEWF